jgi:hypothetical protein
MMDRWKTIDNYYQKKMMYKANKTQIPILSQGTQNGKIVTSEHEFESKSYNSQSQVPKMRKPSNREKKYSYNKVPQLRENKIKDFYSGHDHKNVESSRNYTKKLK